MVKIVPVESATPLAVDFEVATMLANADVVISDATTLDALRQCIGPNAEQIALVGPQPSARYAREIEEAARRHVHDDDAIVVYLSREDGVGSGLAPEEAARAMGRLLRGSCEYEVVPGVYTSLANGDRMGVSLPRTGPLVGSSVIVTRARHQTSELSNLLLEAGAIPIVIPVIEIRVSEQVRNLLKRSVDEAQQASWVVFSSQNAVASIIETPGGLDLLHRARIACIGPATASACTKAGVTVGFVPSQSGPEAFVREFPAPSGAELVTYFASGIARPVIEDGLRARGYVVDRVTAYETVESTVSPYVRHRAHGADAIVFTSSSTVTAAVSVFGAAHLPRRIISIGPATTAAIVDVGLVVSREAREQRLDALISALVASLEGPG